MTSPDQPASGSSAIAIVGLALAFGLLAWMVLDTSGILSTTDKIATHRDIVQVTGANWQSEVLDSKLPVVVDFWAPWCVPCVKLSPTINKLAATYSGRVKVAKVNLDEAQDLAAKFRVSAIPTVLIFKGGKVVDVVQQPISDVTLAQAIDPLLSP